MVGTTNMSMAATSGTWLRKKVRHPWLGGRRRLTMYLATLDCAISNPSLSSSPFLAALFPARPFLQPNVLSLDGQGAWLALASRDTPRPRRHLIPRNMQ